VSDQTYLITMGNRTTDKSGAGRMSGKVKNAVTQLEMESNLDDWVEWALTSNIDPVLIQFLRFKPDLLDKYDPDEAASPTPRQWELVNRVPTALPQGLFFEDVKGKVGKGPAVEYTSFRKIYESLVSFDDVIADPDKVQVPTDLSAQYAIIGSLAHRTTVDNLDRVVRYVDRMKPNFVLMFWMDTMRKTPAVKFTKTFITWASGPGRALLG
jgi:hypothetical protein